MNNDEPSEDLSMMSSSNMKPNKDKPKEESDKALS